MNEHDSDSSAYFDAPVALASIDRHQCYTRVNACFASMTGLPAEQHPGCSVTEYPPITGSAFTDALERILRDDEFDSDFLVTGCTRADAVAEKAWVCNFSRFGASASHSFGVNLAISHDPMQRDFDLEKTADQPKFQDLADAIPHAIGLVAGDGVVTYANRAWIHFFGLDMTADNLPVLLDFIHPEESGVVKEYFADLSLDENHTFACEVRLYSAAGQYVWHLLEARLHKDIITDDYCWFAACTDISRQKATELSLDRRTRRLTEEDRRKDEFLAVLGHEIRNPLAAIDGALTTLESPANRDERDWAMQVMRLQLEQMSNLINNLLDDARIRQGKFKLDKQIVDISSIISVSVESGRPDADAKDITLNVNLPAGDVAIVADRTRLEQIVSNLVNNAVRYTPEKGEVTVSADIDNKMLMIRVRDNGIGIPADMLDEIFDPFTQLDVDGGDAGLGVGLSLVKKLVKRHGGSIKALSQGEGTGTEFVVTLPGVTRNKPEETKTTKQVSSILPDGLRLLLVDDNEAAVSGLQKMLEMGGANVKVAHTGRDGLEMFMSHKFDAAILDIGLPDISGHQLARQIRNSQKNIPVKLIALTGYGHDAAIQDALASGFDEHMVKPADYQHLVAMLANC